MQLRHSIRIGAALSLLLLAACTPEPSGKGASAPVMEQAAPMEWADADWDTAAEALAKMRDSPSLRNFTTMDLNGEEVSQSIFQDEQLTMISIWETSCVPCLDEMPILGDIAREYSGKGVQIVGIVVDVQKADSAAIDESQIAAARQAVEKANAGYRHLLPSNDLIAGVLRGVTQIPAKIFVDSGGNIVGEMVEGARSYHEWVNIMEKRMEMITSTDG